MYSQARFSDYTLYRTIGSQPLPVTRLRPEAIIVLLELFEKSACFTSWSNVSDKCCNFYFVLSPEVIALFKVSSKKWKKILSRVNLKLVSFRCHLRAAFDHALWHLPEAFPFASCDTISESELRKYGEHYFTHVLIKKQILIWYYHRCDSEALENLATQCFRDMIFDRYRSNFT